jgi:hypothetical protein
MLYSWEKKTPVPIGQKAGWASEMVWTQTLEEKSFASAGDQTPVVQSVIRLPNYSYARRFTYTTL